MTRIIRLTRTILFARALLLALAGLAFAACGDDDDDATPTAAAATATTAGEAQTATKPPATATTGVQPTVAPDGTVDPLNAGDTKPVTVKGNPDPFTSIAILEDVRMGVHPEQGGWERIVFEFAGSGQPPATVEYVTTGAVACGSGQTVALPGTTVLHVRIASTQAHNDTGNATIASPNMTGPGNTILKATQTCDFEGVVVWDLGMKGTRNFKVTKLINPTRLVIDVKQ